MNCFRQQHTCEVCGKRCRLKEANNISIVHWASSLQALCHVTWNLATYCIRGDCSAYWKTKKKWQKSRRIGIYGHSRSLKPDHPCIHIRFFLNSFCKISTSISIHLVHLKLSHTNLLLFSVDCGRCSSTALPLEHHAFLCVWVYFILFLFSPFLNNKNKYAKRVETKTTKKNRLTCFLFFFSSIRHQVSHESVAVGFDGAVSNNNNNSSKAAGTKCKKAPQSDEPIWRGGKNPILSVCRGKNDDILLTKSKMKSSLLACCQSYLLLLHRFHYNITVVFCARFFFLLFLLLLCYFLFSFMLISTLWSFFFYYYYVAKRL